MKASGLSSNTGKTEFIMFTRHPQGPICVGNVEVQEASSVKLVGFTLEKDLTWKKHLESLKSDLKGRLGILRRLSWHLPKATLVRCLTPVFMSKLQSGLSLVTNPFSHEDPNLRKCPVIMCLQKLQNEAMRIVLGKRLVDKVSEASLLQQCQQLPVSSLALRAHSNLSWSLLSSSEKQSTSGVRERLDRWQSNRNTRQNNKDTFPTQGTGTDTLLARLTACWNNLPEDIKASETKKQAAYKIKKLYPIL